jgi:hypothetical protein
MSGLSSFLSHILPGNKQSAPRGRTRLNPAS